MADTRRKSMTLAEHDALLKAEGRWEGIQERKRQQEAQRQEQLAEYRLAETPLREGLHRVGYPVKSVWDLVNTATPYATAVPVLLEHLQRPYPAAVREGIARALAVREAEFALPVLLRLFDEEQIKRVKDGLAAAIAVTGKNDLATLIMLARDVGHGTSRCFLISPISKSRDPRAQEALAELANDPDLSTEIRAVTRRRKRQH